MPTRSLRTTTEAHSEASPASADPTIYLCALMVAAGDRVLKLQQETSQQAFAANSKYLELPTDRDQAAAMAGRLPLVVQEHFQRFALATQVYVGILAQAQIEMTRYLFEQAMAQGSPLQWRPAGAPQNAPERRVRAAVINFPDRRVALAAAVSDLVARATTTARSAGEERTTIEGTRAA